MPIRGSPNGARHPRPQVVAIARNRWSRSVGNLVAINWNDWSSSIGMTGRHQPVHALDGGDGWCAEQFCRQAAVWRPIGHRCGSRAKLMLGRATTARKRPGSTGHAQTSIAGASLVMRGGSAPAAVIAADLAKSGRAGPDAARETRASLQVPSQHFYALVLGRPELRPARSGDRKRPRSNVFRTQSHSGPVSICELNSRGLQCMHQREDRWSIGGHDPGFRLKALYRRQ